MVVIRDQMVKSDEKRLHIVLDLEHGFTAYFGGEQAPDDSKYFETWDSALLALHIGPTDVPGVEDA